MEARESKVPQVEMSKETQGGQCSWGKADQGETSREVVCVCVCVGASEGICSEKMETHMGWWEKEPHGPIYLVLC